MTAGEADRIEEVYRKRDATPYTHFNPGQLCLIQQQERAMLRALRAGGIDANSIGLARIFEVGCGTGDMLRSFVRWGAGPANCAGADIRAGAIKRGRAVSPNISLFQADCVDTAEPDGAYDLVVQNIVFSSVLEKDIRAALAREMIRIARPGGLILWCDLRVGKPRNPDVVPTRKDELIRLFAGCELEACRPVLLAPPIARKLAPVSTVLCDVLAALPFLCGHYIATFRKPDRTVP